MENLEIDPMALEKLKDFKTPEEVGFGKVLSPIMFVADYSDGKWGPLRLLPYGPISLDPTTKVLHYGQEIFEGMKAYKCEGHGPFLFRPDQNFKRFNHSARRMAMPEVPEEHFVGGVKAMVSYCSSFIPTKSGESLYIRPFMFATEEHLGIKPSTDFKFLIVASPSGSYFTGESVEVLIEREAARACIGGTGTAKTGGNYAASLLSSMKAKDKGCQQVLWLDAREHKYIEEMSGMNFCAVINGELVTPRLTDTILEGITRKSVLEIAPSLGLTVHEKALDINELIEKIKSGECTEAFACGTAAIITPIRALNDSNGERYELKDANDSPISNKLRNKLLDIQEGRDEGPEGWVIKVENLD